MLNNNMEIFKSSYILSKRIVSLIRKLTIDNMRDGTDLNKILNFDVFRL